MLAHRITKSGLIAVASRRTHAIASHFMSTSSAAPAPSGSGPSEPPVLFESHGTLRKFTLNRPSKLNSLDQRMLDLLRPKVLEWAASNLCQIVVGVGEGRAFCAGGDVVGVVQASKDEHTRSRAIDFFHHEYELDLYLAALPKPYVAVMDGITMGGGVGLAVNAPFRIATEKTQYAMPETKIGFSPDVGASFFLHNLDGHLGTYLALTGDVVKGRAVYELGLATHYVPSRRIPELIARLSSMEDASYEAINATIEEHSAEITSEDTFSDLVGPIREAIDASFAHNRVDKIFKTLREFESAEQESVRSWAQKTLKTLEERSPTSLKVALHAIRKGKSLSLAEALQMELGVATAYCSGASPDFATGVNAVLVDKAQERPTWSPAHVDDVADSDVAAKFFSLDSEFLQKTPKIRIPEVFRNARSQSIDPMRFALPREDDIGLVVKGAHGTSSSFAMTLPQLLEKFESMTGSKAGVREKILEVVSRKTTTTPRDSEGVEWLVWKH